MFSKEIYRNYKTFFSAPFQNKTNYSELATKVLKVTTISILTVAVVSSVVTYLFVLSKENSIQALHSKTYTTQMDNIDIRNDVEFTKSIYNVHDKAKSISYLHKPDKILEINCNTDYTTVNINDYKALTQNRIVSGY